MMRGRLEEGHRQMEVNLERRLGWEARHQRQGMRKRSTRRTGRRTGMTSMIRSVSLLDESMESS